MIRVMKGDTRSLDYSSYFEALDMTFMWSGAGWGGIQSPVIFTVPSGFA